MLALADGDLELGNDVPVVLGTGFALLLGACVVLGSATWRQSHSHEKQLVTEIWSDVRDRFPSVVRRGSEAGFAANRFFRGNSTDEPGRNGH